MLSNEEPERVLGGLALRDRSVLLAGHEGLGWWAQPEPIPLDYLGAPEKTGETFVHRA